MSFVLRIAVFSLLLSAQTALGERSTIWDVEHHTFEHNERSREYYLYKPQNPSRFKSQASLMFVLHGGGGRARGMIRQTRESFNKLANQHNIYIVYPQGVGRAWNDGRTESHLSKAVREKVDDIGFFSELIDYLITRYPIDQNRVFATGISNGGFMSFALGCFLDDKIRGIAPVTATLTDAVFPRCTSKTSTALVLFNGTEDPLVPFNGGPITVLGRERGSITSTQKTIDRWVERSGCTNRTTITRLPDRNRDLTTIDRYDYGGCSNGGRIVLFRINGGGHTWPGGRQYLPVILIGRVSYDINAAKEMWNIFSSLP